MTSLRITSLLVLLLFAACGEEEQQTRGVGGPREPVDESSSDAGGTTAPIPNTTDPVPVPTPTTDADTSNGGDGDVVAEEVEEPLPPPPEQPPGLVKALVSMGQARFHTNKNQPGQAVKALKRAVAVYPDEGWLHIELAKACLTAEDNACALSAAETAFEKANGQASLEAMAALLQGRAHKAAGNLEAAADALKRSIKVSPSEAVVTMMGELYPPDAGVTLPELPEEVACTYPVAEGDSFVASLSGRSEARDASICPVLEEPYNEADTSGAPASINIMAFFRQHRDAAEILSDQGGLAAIGSFPLFLVRIVRDQPEIVVLDEGRDRERQDEIVSEISANLQRITLGPSRPGIVVELTTRGWWNVGSRNAPYPFERTELFVVSRHLTSLATLVRQVTYESGHVEADDCLFGMTSSIESRAGSIWLEDLDLSGVPEICQESTNTTTPRPEWMGERQPPRVDSSCHEWVASELHVSSRPVPSLSLDEFERERARTEVLDVSRVPTTLRMRLRTHIRENEVILASKGLELTASGAHAIAVLANDSSVHVLTANAGDSMTRMEISKLGRWEDIWASIDSDNPRLIKIQVIARGRLEGAVERQWLNIVSAGPGKIPSHSLSVESHSESPLDENPCPHLIASKVRIQERDDAHFLSLAKRRIAGPGSRADTLARRGLCTLVRQNVFDADAGPPPLVEPPDVAGQICRRSREDLETERYAQGSDGRFARTTLP